MLPTLAIIGYGKHGRYLGSILTDLGVAPKYTISSSNLNEITEALTNSTLLVLSCPPSEHNKYVTAALQSKSIRRIYLEKPFQLSSSVVEKLSKSDIQVLTGLWLRETELYSIFRDISKFQYISIHHSHDWQIRSPADHEGITNRLLIHFFDLIFSNHNTLIHLSSVIFDLNTCCLQLKFKNTIGTLIHIFLSYSTYPLSKIVASTAHAQLMLDNGNLLKFKQSSIVEGKSIALPTPISSDTYSSFSELMRVCTQKRLHRFLFEDINHDDLSTALASESALQVLLTNN